MARGTYNKVSDFLGTHNFSERFRKVLQLRQLQALGKLTLPLPSGIETAPIEELRRFCEQNQSLLCFHSLDLNKLRTQTCSRCRQLPPGALPKYKPPDTSAIEPIPGFVVQGAVSTEDLDGHDFKILTTGSTCGTVQGLDSTLQVGLFVHFLEADQMLPRQLYNFQTLASLFHSGASHGSPARSNGAWSAAGRSE